MHGIIRRSSSFNTGRIEHLYKDQHEKQVKLFLHYGDLTDSSNLFHIISEVRPDEIYNLAAQSHVKVSFEMPEYTGEAPPSPRAGCEQPSAKRVDGAASWPIFSQIRGRILQNCV